jgi:U3 small nucleolar RNA-associated protein 19
MVPSHPVLTCHSDYPNFYQRLYALLDANALHVRYRARFFRLIDTFLRSALLPASFIKRLSRLALTGPPAGVIMVIPFVYNLFKRHPGCMVMLQRLDDGDGEYNGESTRLGHGPQITDH